MRRRRTSLAAGAAGAVLAALSARNACAADDLSQLSIEELAQVEVVSVSRRPEAIGQAPAAVYLITEEDIRRTGVLTLPEALRLAPNLQVARVDALDYSVSARGFGGIESANKLLVMLDGRIANSPLFNGVEWDQYHVLLDDLDRIEVVSGPGGALWGANAVNGVINVVTRSARETKGVLAVASAGSPDSDLRLRYGGDMGEDGAYRVYLTGYERGDLKTAAGASARDGWEGLQGGFRVDAARFGGELTVQGDVHDNTIEETIGLPGYVRGHNLLTRLTRPLANGGGLELQAYYDHSEREAQLIYDRLTALDLQFQHAMAPMGRHTLTWGGGVRQTDDDFRILGGGVQLLDPASRRVTITNLFVQDETRLGEDITLTLGLKGEDNSYTQFELMPSVRLGWRVTERHTLWAAVSRAVRNPSRIERDFSLPGVVVPGFFDAEVMVAYEAGYKGRPTRNTSLSLTLFYDDYDKLRTNDLAAPATLPIHVGNTMEGEVAGFELWGEFDVTPWWRLSFGWTQIDKSLRLKPGSLDIAGFEAGGVDPDHWAKLRSRMTFENGVELDLRLRGYDETPNSQASGYLGAPSYIEADARVSWPLREGAEVFLVGSNLLNDQHPEASEARRTEVPRGAYIGVRWRR